MMQTGNSTDQLSRLQDETMRQLEVIAAAIDSGQVTLDEGTARADALVHESAEKSAVLTQERLLAAQRLRGRKQLQFAVAGLALALALLIGAVMFTS